jgi:hypothetical protein
MKRVADTLPRRMHAILFKKPHPLAGQVVRRGREACIYFNRDEAEIVDGLLEAEGKVPRGTTEIVTVFVKEWRKALKPGMQREPR